MKQKGTAGNQGSVDKTAEGKVGRQGPTSSDEIRGSADDLSSPETYKRSSGTSRDQENLESTLDMEDSSNEDLEQEDITGSSDEDIKSMNYSDTDEDEDEGLGDGNLGRTIREI